MFPFKEESRNKGNGPMASANFVNVDGEYSRSRLMPSFRGSCALHPGESDCRLRGEIDGGLRIAVDQSSESILDLLNFSPPKNGEQCHSTGGNWR